RDFLPIPPQYAISRNGQDLFRERGELYPFSTRGEGLHQILPNGGRRSPLYVSIYWVVGVRFSSKHDKRGHLFVSQEQQGPERQVAFVVRVQPHGLFGRTGQWQGKRWVQANFGYSTHRTP